MATAGRSNWPPASKPTRRTGDLGGMVKLTNYSVTPAQAGVQHCARGADVTHIAADAAFRWIPACAGMTALEA